jgi:hypothetical protein
MQTRLASFLFRLAAGLALVAFACGFQYAYITNTTTGLPLKWTPGTIPMKVMVDNATLLTDGNTRQTSIFAAMQDPARGWNQYLGNVQFAPTTAAVGNGTDNNGVNEIFFSSSPYNQSWDTNTLAITTAWYNGNQRVEADIIFNTAYTWDSYRGTEKSSPVDLQRVALHELGHVLGLDHPDTATPPISVTSIINSHVSNTDSLQAYDVSAAQFIYGPPGVPPNNNFASATTITLVNNAAALTGYNTNATKETGEPNHANNAGGRSVWWKWTPSSSGTATITTAGSVFDTILAVYTGASVSGLTLVASNDDVQDGIIQSSTVTFSATAGTTYDIAVDGFNNTPNDNYGADSGGIALNVAFTPANSVLSETVVSGHGVTFSVSAAVGTIQWQVSTDGGTTYTNLNNDSTYSGVTSSNLTIAAVTSGMSGFKYRAIVTVSGVASPSNPGTLTVAAAVFNFPTSITIDSLGNLYVGDSSLDTVQKITSATTVTTLAGSAGLAGSADGTGSAARFNQPGGLSATTAGVLGVSDTANATLRVIQTDGTVSTLAGSPTVHGNTDATGSAASFSSPIGIGRDASGNLYIADAMNHTIRKVTSAGVVTTLAGNPGVAGYVDNTGNVARFNYPTGLAVDSNGNVFVADTTNELLRKVTSAGVVTTLAGVVGVTGSTDGLGSAALFNTPGGLAVDSSGNLYLADTGNSTIRKITSGGAVTTLAGLPGIAGFKDGNGSEAWFNQPKALTLDSSGNVYVADTGNAAIRKITPAGVVTTLTLTASTGTSTTTSTTTIPPTGGGSSGGGGGGGAPSTWFFGALSLLALARRLSFRKK